jgi:glutathionylspermidine synthase
MCGFGIGAIFRGGAAAGVEQEERYDKQWAKPTNLVLDCLFFEENMNRFNFKTLSCIRSSWRRITHTHIYRYRPRMDIVVVSQNVSHFYPTKP